MIVMAIKNVKWHQIQKDRSPNTIWLALKVEKFLHSGIISDCHRLNIIILP